MMKITVAQAQQFILSRQGLLGKHRFAGKAGAYAYIRQAGCIQFDPVDVCGRNAELTLQSRVKSFQKKIFLSCCTQIACWWTIPTRNCPSFRRRTGRILPRIGI